MLRTFTNCKALTTHHATFHLPSILPPKIPPGLSDMIFCSRNYPNSFISPRIFPDVLWSHPLLMSPRPCLLSKSNFIANLWLPNFTLAHFVWNGFTFVLFSSLSTPSCYNKLVSILELTSILFHHLFHEIQVWPAEPYSCLLFLVTFYFKIDPQIALAFRIFCFNFWHCILFLPGDLLMTGGRRLRLK